MTYHYPLIRFAADFQFYQFYILGIFLQQFFVFSKYTLICALLFIFNKVKVTTSTIFNMIEIFYTDIHLFSLLRFIIFKNFNFSDSGIYRIFEFLIYHGKLNFVVNEIICFICTKFIQKV